MIRVDKQSKRTTTTKKKKKSNRINKSRVLKNIKNYQPKEKMQEKLKKSTKKLRERERERERDNFFFFGEEKLYKEWKRE